MVQFPPPFGPAELTVRQLLASSVAVVDQSLRSKLIRPRNAPLGDLAESLALRAYGWTFAPDTDKSSNLLAPDGVRLQVKARMVQPNHRRSQAFSAVRSWDFDVALFVLFDAGTYDLTWVQQRTRERLVRSDGRLRAHELMGDLGAPGG